MGRIRAALVAGILSALPALAFAHTQIPTPPAKALIEAALKDDRAYAITRDLSTDIGPRLAGTEAEARARDWAVARLTQEGFTHARVETFPLTAWERVIETATIVGPHAQRLEVHATGGSPSTPAEGIVGEVARFADMAALRASAPASLTGKIAFVDDIMPVTEDGSGYGKAVVKRRECSSVAAELGAIGCLIRSAGTSEREVHVGQGARGQQGKLPVLILANADANQLGRVLEKGPTQVRMQVQTKVQPEAQSGNVIAEMRGTERPNEYVVLACHLDSWDLGTGALDDAVGCGIVTAAAKLVGEIAGPPKRSIRIIWYGAEEVGLIGAAAHAQAIKSQAGSYVFAAESDSGDGKVYQADFGFGAGTGPVKAAIAKALKPLGVARGTDDARGQSDISTLRPLGVPVMDLHQDASKYFAIHHTPDDILEKVDLASVRQNVAVYAVTAWFAAWITLDFRAE
jgi:hypothetical protein